jgi:hypothetical protein
MSLTSELRAPQARNMTARGKRKRSERVAPGLHPKTKSRPEGPK